MQAASFVNTKAAREFMLAGKATVTVVSVKTQKRFTFTVHRADKGGLWFVSVRVEGKRQYLGELWEKRDAPPAFHHGKKSKIPTDDPSARAFAWVWQRVAFGEQKLADSPLEVWHEGKCGRCGRQLTAPESIVSGLGPVCEGAEHA